MKNKLKKWTIFCASALSIASISSLIVSCAQNEQKKQNSESINQNDLNEVNNQTNKDNHYQPNKLFLNKLNNNSNPTPLNIVVSSSQKNEFKYPLALVYKVFRGEEFEITSLPKNIEVLNDNNESKWFNVTWNIAQNFKVTRDFVIKGVFNNGSKNIDVNAYIFSQTKRFVILSSYQKRDDGMSIDINKSSHDGGANNLAKLINRDGDYANTGSRWDNWSVYDREQNTNFVFHWEKPTNISRLTINFWRNASRGGSDGILPKNIYIQTSNDGENWVNVNNQDKISASDFGPMNTYSNRLLNVSETKVINFDNIQTQWLRFHWEPATDAQNRNLIIGITNMEFYGKDRFDDNLITNKSNKILGIKNNDETLALNQNSTNDYVFNIKYFDDNFSFISHSSLIEKHLISESENQKIYKVISYNDVGEKIIYQITFNKN